MIVAWTSHCSEDRLLLCTALVVAVSLVQAPLWAADSTKLPDTPDASHQCRFVGIIGDVVPDTTTDELLDDLQTLATSNPDGWGIAFWAGSYGSCDFVAPAVYRGADQATTSLHYDYAQAVVAGGAGPTLVFPHPGVEAMIGHIRNASSSCADAPDPHPFIRHKRAFAHNGGVATDVLLDLIEPRWLTEASTSPATDPPVDSDLYFIYLLQEMNDSTDTCVTSMRIWRAIWDLKNALEAAAEPRRLNMVYTDGNTMWAVRYASSSQAYYTVDYCVPSDGQTWRAVASEPSTGCPGGWVPLDNYRLIQLSPGRTPRIYNLNQDPATAPNCNISTLY